MLRRAREDVRPGQPLGFYLPGEGVCSAEMSHLLSDFEPFREQMHEGSINVINAIPKF